MKKKLSLILIGLCLLLAACSGAEPAASAADTPGQQISEGALKDDDAQGASAQEPRDTETVPSKTGIAIDPSKAAQKTEPQTGQSKTEQQANQPKTTQTTEQQTGQDKTAQQAQTTQTAQPPGSSGTKDVQAAAEKKSENAVTISVWHGERKIIDKASFEMTEGSSVFDILKKVTKEKKIQMEFSGVGNAVYIEGIDNIYEFDEGPESGWMYSVNGKFQNKSCGTYQVKAGDVIEWKYTKNMGKDVKAGTL